MRKFYPLLLAALAGCSSNDKPATVAAPVKAVFDVPALLPQTIDQIKATLGKTEGNDDEPTKQQITAGVKEWEKSFKRDTTTLLVTYDPKTRKVIDFFVSTNHGKTADVAPLTQLANVDPAKPNGIDAVPVPMLANKQLFTGVKLVRK